MVDINIDIKNFQRDLLEWYYHHKRDLPWRENQDPYRIWVSEVMLQQTKVDTVIPYFNQFIEKFPSPEVLANAEEEEVLKAWEGLGYYSRVRNLHSAVKEVVEEYDGKIPHEKKEFSSLKGVGPYTAGAVMSIAYEKAEPAVDGNVMRVFSRIMMIKDDIGKAKTRKIFEGFIPEFLEGVRPSQFNQALMELGAVVCTPKSPGCLLCPVQDYCQAREEGMQEELPVKGKKKAPVEKQMAAAIVTNQKGQALFHQRSNKGLLARLWEYPNVEVPESTSREEAIKQFLYNEYDIKTPVSAPIQYVQHVFSHLIWNISVHEAQLEYEPAQWKNFKWMYPDEAKEYAFPVSHQKILKSHLERREIERRET